MKNILLLSTLIFCCNVYSQTEEWQYLGEQSNGTGYYYKSNSEDKAWIKTESPQLEYFNKEGQKKHVDGYQVTLWQFDCADKQIGIVQATAYDKMGNFLSSLSFKSYEINMMYVNPDSVGEVYLRAFCQRD